MNQFAMDKKKAKIKSYNWKINTSFRINKIPRQGSQFICLSVTLIDFVFKTGNTFYPEVSLEECKCVVKKIITKYRIHNSEFLILKKRIPNSDEENSNEKNSDERDSDEKKFKKS